MTEHDQTGPDEPHRRRSAGNDRAADDHTSGSDPGSGSDDGGRTRVISTGAGRPDAASPAVHIPAQAGPPPGGAAATTVGPPPAHADPTRGYGPGEGYGAPTTVGPSGRPGYGDGRPAGSAAPQGYGAPQTYGAPQGHGAHQPYGSPQTYGAPPAYGSPQGHGGPQGYGSPQAYGSPQGYGAGQGYDPAQAYGSAQGYGSPQGYGAPPGHGAPQGYGAPYGAAAYAPPHGAAPTSVAGLPPAPGYGAPAGEGPLGPPPPGYAPPPTGGGRRRTTVVIALVAVLVLLAGGLGTYFYLRGGGADSPAEATRLLADDLQSGDLPGAMTRLHPDEVALAGDVGGMVHDELVRLQVLRPDADENALLTGTTFTDLRFDDTAVEQVRPNVAIAKLVGGTVTVNRDVNTLPLTDSYKKIAYPDGVPPAQAPEVIDIAKVVADQGRPVRIATVQVDGDWYVSVGYTLADAALVEEGQTWPQGTVAPRGSATAQDAVRDATSALFAQDVKRLVELSPPHELAVLHDVGPLLVDRAGRSGSSSGSTARLVDLATTPTQVDGGTALTVDRLVVAEDGGQQVTVVRDGDCLSLTTTGGYSGGSPTRVCAQDVANQGVGSFPDSADPAVRDVMVRAARAALGLRIVVVEDGGQYYVSPVRTVAGLGVDVLRTLQPTDLARLAAVTQPR